jgi:hypothetical protein
VIAKHGRVIYRLLTGLISLTAIFVARSEVLPAEIPFVFTNGLIRIAVNMPETKEPLQFLFDSGAAVSVLDLRTAQRIGLKTGQAVPVKGVGGTRQGFWTSRLEAKAGAVALPQRYLAVDLAQLDGACNGGVDGLLGADFLRGKIVQIDFVACKLRLLPKGTPFEEGVVLNLRKSRGALLASVSVNGSRLQWVRVDTGCTSALHWVADAPPARGASTAVSVGLGELSIPVGSASVRLGDHLLESIPTGWHSKAIFPGEGGLLGNGLLSRFERVTFDAPAGKLVLSGNASKP